MSNIFKRRPAGITSSLGLALVLGAGLSACSIELTNPQPAREMAEAAKPAGSVYPGWRVFQAQCASCHGVDASGSASAPDLLPRVRTMGENQFVSLVLKRYDWGLPQATRQPGPEHEAMVVQQVQRKGQPLSMPAWQGEPVVQAHIVDVYAYLTARAQGTQGVGRPRP